MPAGPDEMRHLLGRAAWDEDGCVSSSDLAPLVVMNPGSSIPAELGAGVIIGGMVG